MPVWRELARDSYGAASLLAQARRWRSAVSRAYYAVFALVAFALVRKGVTMPRGREGPSHAKLAALVSTHLPELGGAKWRVFGQVKGLYALRIDADYMPSSRVDRARSYVALSMMSEVFRDLKEML